MLHYRYVTAKLLSVGPDVNDVMKVETNSCDVTATS